MSTSEDHVATLAAELLDDGGEVTRTARGLAVEIVASALGGCVTLFYVASEDGLTLDLHSHHGASPELLQRMGSIPLESATLVASAARTMSASDADGAAPDAPQDARVGADLDCGRWAVALPFVKDRRLIGVLACFAPWPSDGRPRMLQMLSTLGSLLAVALARDPPDPGPTGRRYPSLFGRAADAILVMDDQGRMVDANPAACELFRTSRAELTRGTLFDLALPELSRMLQETWREFLASGTFRGEGCFRRADGSTFTGEFADMAYFMPHRHACILRDISARKAIEEKLRRSEQRLSRAQQIGQIGSWEWESRSDELVWSEECFRLFGADPANEKKTYNEFLDFVHPDDRSAVERAVTQALAGVAPLSMDYRIIRPDGQERIVHAESETLFDEEGRVSGMCGTVQDVTERRMAKRERLRLEEERELLVQALSIEQRWLRAVIDRSPIGILLCELQDAKTARFIANRRAEELLGCRIPSKGALEVILDRLYLPDGSRLTYDDLSLGRAIRGEMVTGRELLIRRPPAADVPILTNASPIRSDNGQILGAVVTYEDITSLKELERLRQEWTSVVAHDLRQPVTTIMTFAGLLARTTSDERARARAQRIIETSRRLDRMIGDLLDVSRIEARRLALMRSPTELPALLARVIEASGARDRVALSIADHLPKVTVDAQRIEQVVENLLSNALKYGDPETTIEIGARQKGEDAVIFVRNRGPGIAESDQGTLFARFQRGRARGGPIEGLGLGLYIVRGLVEAHGGSVEVHSIPGETTTFSFTLPIHPRGDPRPAEG